MSENIGQAIADGDLVAVSKDFFFEGMVLPVPVFLKIKTNHYLIIGKKNERASFSQYHSLQNSKTQLFVRKQDHSSLLQYATDLTGKVIAQKNVPDGVKVKFLAGLTAEALGSFDEKGVLNVQQIQRVSQFMMDLSSNSAFNDIMDLVAQLSNEEVKHAVGTSVLALSLCDEMQITLKAAQEKVVMGSLLHDIGMRFIGRDLSGKPKHLWTPEDQAAYESHCLKGVELLRNLKDISNDILLIIAEHHENAIGTGFPKKLRDVKISPLSRIVIVANYFAELVFLTPEQGKTYTADEAISYMEEILGQPFSKPVFSALKNIVNKRFLQDKIKPSV